jgi:two-component system sensor histidine kinase AtoS
MKKKIFAGFIILSVCFTVGGLYITRSIDRVIVKLESIITLHQVEILRKSLLTDVKAVQQDLLLKGSPHATAVDAFLQHGEKMGTEVEACFDCHHDAPTEERLEQLQAEVLVYQRALSRIYTIRANRERLQSEKQVAFHIGRHLINKIDQIIDSTSQELAGRTETAMEDIAATKQILTLLVIAGPVLGLTIAIFFARQFAGSMQALLNATRRLKTGDLGHKIEGLHDEFGELGDSFNEMALSLRGTIQEIEENQKRYRMLFESAGDAIFILEAEGAGAGRIVSANQAAADMYGYTVEELLELRMQDLDTPEAEAESPERIRRTLSGEWIDAEISHRRRDGTVFPVEISAGLLEFEDRKYILAFNRDISERKQAEEALQRAEQLVIVGEMAAGLAHEIKNPLSGIRFSIEVIAGELQLNQEHNDILSRIIDEINRIETLLKNLLNYAVPPTPNFAPLDLNGIIEAAVQTAELSLKSPSERSRSGEIKDIQFVRDLDDQLPQIVADSAKLQQVILNLLLNAIYAIQENGTISVETSADGKGFIQILVSDTGKGIDGQDIKRVFLPFFTTKPKGTGLGLSICKRLIEQQNGTINVARNPKGGLMFTIVLPVEQAGGIQLR